MNELNGYKVSDCVHAIDLYENEIKEVCCQCDEYGHRNITLGDCFGNCDCQESDRQWGKTNELKPCPFCGGEASLRDEPDRYYKYTVYCTKCGIGTTAEHIKSIAIGAWNNRRADDGR